MQWTSSHANNGMASEARFLNLRNFRHQDLSAERSGAGKIESTDSRKLTTVVLLSCCFLPYFFQ
jgi:hypothetical protein